MIEIIPNRYGVDHRGNVYSLRNNAGNRRASPKIMKPNINKKGYHYIIGYTEENGITKKKLLLIHRLVAEAYIPNPFGKPEVNHKDGIKSHNSVSNLEWATKKENADHAFALGLRTPNRGQLGRTNQLCVHSKPIHQLDMNGNFIQEFPSMAEAKRAGFSQGNISSVCLGKRQSHRGFKWAYA